ncbi:MULTISPECIES: sigma-70 family RNA polymerase sigma factor [Cupriavidus]
MLSAVPASHAVVAHWYEAHHRWLAAWVARRFSCSHRAADLTQDVFLRVLARGDAAEVREPRAFLLRVAQGMVVDAYRRAALEQAYLAELAYLPPAQQPSPEARALVCEALAAVDRLLGSLSERMRAAFLLSRLDGLPHAEIAARLGVSVARVSQYLTVATERCYIAIYGEPAA